MMIVILHLDGRKSLRIIFLSAILFRRMNTCCCDLRRNFCKTVQNLSYEPFGHAQNCKDGKPHEEDSSSSVILESNEVQVGRQARNFSIAWEGKKIYDPTENVGEYLPIFERSLECGQPLVAKTLRRTHRNDKRYSKDTRGRRCQSSLRSSLARSVGPSSTT